MTAVTILLVAIIVICSISLAIMLVGFSRHRQNWNTKTRDYWYGRIMWKVAAISFSIEGLVHHTPFRYTLVFIIVAALVTLKGNLQKGDWGNHAADK